MLSTCLSSTWFAGVFLSTDLKLERDHPAHHHTLSPNLDSESSAVWMMAWSQGTIVLIPMHPKSQVLRLPRAISPFIIVTLSNVLLISVFSVEVENLIKSSSS